MTHDQAEAFVVALERYVGARIKAERHHQRGEHRHYFGASEDAELMRKELIARLAPHGQPGDDELAAARARRDDPGLVIATRATPAGVELDVDLDPPPGKR